MLLFYLIPHTQFHATLIKVYQYGCFHSMITNLCHTKLENEQKHQGQHLMNQYLLSLWTQYKPIRNLNLIYYNQI